MVEIQYHKNKPYVVGNFIFKKEDMTPSHPTSFRKWKPIKFALPLLIELPVHENVDNDEIYEVIGEQLKLDFIEFIKNNRPK